MYMYVQVRIDSVCGYRKLQLQFESPGLSLTLIIHEMMIPLSLEVYQFKQEIYI